MSESTQPKSRFEIRTPNKGFDGLRGGIAFDSGVGYTDDPEKAALAKSLGYEVTDARQPAAADKKPPKKD